MKYIIDDDNMLLLWVNNEWTTVGTVQETYVSSFLYAEIGSIFNTNAKNALAKEHVQSSYGSNRKLLQMFIYNRYKRIFNDGEIINLCIRCYGYNPCDLYNGTIGNWPYFKVNDNNALKRLLNHLTQTEIKQIEII